MDIKILVSIDHYNSDGKENHILIDQTICGLSSRGNGIESPDIYLKREILGAIREITARSDFMGIKYDESQRKGDRS